MANTNEKRMKLEVGKFNRDSWAIWGYVMRTQGTWGTAELITGRYNTREQAKEAAQDMAQYLTGYGWKVNL